MFSHWFCSLLLLKLLLDFLHKNSHQMSFKPKLSLDFLEVLKLIKDHLTSPMIGINFVEQKSVDFQLQVEWESVIPIK